MKRPLSSIRPTVLGLLMAAAAAMTSPAATLLWSVGVKDTNTAELAGQKAPEQIPVPAWSVVSLRAERP